MNLLAESLQQLIQMKKKRDLRIPPLNLEDILFRIQMHSVKGGMQRVRVSKQQFVGLCRSVRKQCLQQPGLLRLDSPICVATGTLGNYQELSNIIDRVGHPKFINYLFLGNYAGRYEQSIECLIALFAYRLINPNNFFLLRGSHQTISMAKSYHLYNNLLQYFNCSSVFLQVCQTFCALPYAAIIQQKIFCAHGGISPFLQSLQQINAIPRPMDAVDGQLASDLIWADPSHIYDGWTINDRGISASFGADVVKSFMKTHNLSLICRANQVPYQGYSYFADKKVVTICSLSQYCGHLNNISAVMLVDDQHNVLFKLVSGRDRYTGEQKQEGLNFVDMVRKRKEDVKRKQEQEKIKNEKRQEKIRINKERKKLMIVR